MNITTKPYYNFYFQSREQASPFTKDMINQILNFYNVEDKNEKLMMYSHHNSHMLHTIKLCCDQNLIAKYPYAFSSLLNEETFDKISRYTNVITEQSCKDYIYDILMDIIFQMMKYQLEIKENKITYTGEHPEDIHLMANSFFIASKGLDFLINNKKSKEILELVDERAFFFHYTRLADNAENLDLNELLKSLKICYMRKTIPTNAIEFVKKAQNELNHSIDELINS